MNDQKLRIVEKLIGSEWFKCSMSILHAGDIFRMLEPDGTPVHDSSSGHIRHFTAASEPYKSTGGVLGISIEDHDD